jgi:hypothetical protein
MLQRQNGTYEERHEGMTKRTLCETGGNIPLKSNLVHYSKLSEM